MAPKMGPNTGPFFFLSLTRPICFEKNVNDRKNEHVFLPIIDIFFENLPKMAPKALIRHFTEFRNIANQVQKWVPKMGPILDNFRSHFWSFWSSKNFKNWWPFNVFLNAANLKGIYFGFQNGSQNGSFFLIIDIIVFFIFCLRWPKMLL